MKLRVFVKYYSIACTCFTVGLTRRTVIIAYSEREYDPCVLEFPSTPRISSPSSMSTFQFNYQYLTRCTVTILLVVVQSSQQLPLKSGGTYRIINGTYSAITEFPYLVSVQRKGSYNKNHICGGAFISPDWILTAAHCLSEEKAETVIIRAESSFPEWSGTLLKVAQLVVHAKFNASLSKDYDYGLIKLRKTFHRAVSLGLKNVPRRFRPGERCTVMGWGQTATTSLSKRIMKVTVPIVAQGICRDAYRDTEDQITSRMLCAGYPNGGKDACEGDSGGPLICRRMLTGIISWAEGCAESNYYGVYSYVSPMREWIRNKTGV